MTEMTVSENTDLSVLKKNIQIKCLSKMEVYLFLMSQFKR